MRVCSVHGCPTIYEGTDSRCPEHRAAADRKHWDKTKGYNTKGHRQRFRPGVLARDPICVICHVAQSVVADHYPRGRNELIEAGLDPNSPEYGRGLCRDCDHRQSAQRQEGWGSRYN